MHPPTYASTDGRTYIYTHIRMVAQADIEIRFSWISDKNLYLTTWLIKVIHSHTLTKDHISSSYTSRDDQINSSILYLKSAQAYIFIQPSFTPEYKKIGPIVGNLVFQCLRHNCPFGLKGVFACPNPPEIRCLGTYM